MRCFVAIELEPTVRGRIVRFIRERLPETSDARWCGEDQLHITLKFLGEVARSALTRVRDIVLETAVELAPFEINIGGIGCFPPRGSPRVMWMGVDDPTGNCAKWVAGADGPFSELGIERERRTFTPHITLGRTKNRAGGVLGKRLVETLDSPSPMKMRVESLTLFESRRAPAGAKYTSLLNAGLAVR